MTSSFHTKTAAPVRTAMASIFQMLGIEYDFSGSPSFKVSLDCRDGDSVTVDASAYESGAVYHSQVVPPYSIAVPAGGGTLDADMSSGTAVMVASTIAITVPQPADGLTVAVPVGSTVWATVTTPGGVPKKLVAARTSNTQITVSSAGSGYGALLESAGVVGTLAPFTGHVSGKVDVTLANAVGDRLGVVVDTEHGTPGVLSVKRVNGTTVRIESWPEPLSLTDTLVAGTKTSTMSNAVGDLIAVNVQAAAGTAGDRYSIKRVSDTEVKITSHVDPVAATGTLVAGTIDITLANAVGDKLSVALVADNAGTPGVLSVKRKSATEVTVESWLAATGLEVLDVSSVSVTNNGPAVSADTSTMRLWVMGTTLGCADVSDVKAYNFGQAGHETSTVRWAVVRP